MNIQKKSSFRNQLILYLGSIVVPLLIIVFIVDFFTVSRTLQDQIDAERDRIMSSLISTVMLTNKSYKFLEETLEERVTPFQERFLQDYRDAGRNPGALDLEKLRRRLAMEIEVNPALVELSAINPAGRVVVSTSSSREGIDYSETDPEFYRKLQRSLEAQKPASNRVVPYADKSLPRKRIIIPTDDGKHLLEMDIPGVYFSKLREVLNYQNIAESIKTRHEELKSVDIYNRENYNFVDGKYLERNKDADTLTVVRKVFSKKKGRSYLNEDRSNRIVYRYIDLSDPNYLNDPSLVIRFVFDQRVVTKGLQAAAFRDSIFSIVSIFVAILLAVFASRRVLRPVDRLTEGVKRIEEGDLSYRFNRDRCPREFCRLIDSIESMAATINEQIENLQEKDRLLIEANQNLEDRVEERTNDLQTIFHNVYDSIIIRDTEGNVLDANKQMLDLFRVTFDELQSDILRSDLASESNNMTELYFILEDVKKGKDRRFEWRARRPHSREELDVEIFLRKIEYQGKDALMTNIRDISERKQIEREREIYYRLFLESVHPILIADVDGTITHVNPALLELYRCKEEEIVGKKPSILNPGRAAYREFGYSDEDYDHLFSDLWRSILDPARGSWEGELYNKTRDGRILQVHLYISAIRNEKGKITAFSAMPIDVTGHRQQELTIRMEIYRTINELAATRDNETGTHLERISNYTQILSQKLGLPKKFENDIGVYSPLHDIGKVGIPDNILLAPRKLTKDEFEIMKRHATLGYQILKDRPTLEMAADIAHSHHERWDGGGYPQGIAGEDIPQAARITSVADVYDALTHKRHYKEAWSHEDTVELIRNGRGSQFDPQVVDAFLELEESFRWIAASFED
ncbi:MAG: PAS domain S-box protein [Spirochaetales bacterium]|nr:PAS domain S-box protein [Spirochaetales bacterium]MCF7939765.1 PAS domain S-box protein [Spirochaetales bacterium]